MMQTSLLAFVIAWSSFPAGSPLCFCEVSEVAEAFERANAVFVGEVIEIVEPGASDENAPLPNRLYVVRFKVEKSWKGVPFGSEIGVLSDQGRGCFFHPKVEAGKRYLVYADPYFDNGSESRGLMIITNCNRTARLPASAPRSKQWHLQWELNRQDGSGDLGKLDAIIRMPPKHRA